MFLFVFLYFGFFFSNCRNKFVVYYIFDLLVLGLEVNFVVDFKNIVFEKGEVLEKVDVSGERFEVFDDEELEDKIVFIDDILEVFFVSVVDLWCLMCCLIFSLILFFEMRSGFKM